MSSSVWNRQRGSSSADGLGVGVALGVGLELDVGLALDVGRALGVGVGVVVAAGLDPEPCSRGSLHAVSTSNTASTHHRTDFRTLPPCPMSARTSTEAG